MNPDFSTLDGQIAVVTGAGRGIGEVIARTLAHAGASVVLMGVRQCIWTLQCRKSTTAAAGHQA